MLGIVLLIFCVLLGFVIVFNLITGILEDHINNQYRHFAESRPIPTIKKMNPEDNQQYDTSEAKYLGKKINLGYSPNGIKYGEISFFFRAKNGEKIVVDEMTVLDGGFFKNGNLITQQRLYTQREAVY